jgi:hypothetical protein
MHSRMTLVGLIGRTSAESALAGYELIDAVGIDAARRLYMGRNGQAQHLGSIDAVRAHLAQIAAHQ